ncbi:hypothetical protein MTR66_14545 [Novosphingobium sp. 2638]|uniref:Uncharacterized protein n=1 Tax=Novosphingobium beihaiensis TaxID=2930389 RepID=A0ABT0BSK0_9SPHN|nr:hypothetical protein [Novosphingobium beihaiensis]
MDRHGCDSQVAAYRWEDNRKIVETKQLLPPMLSTFTAQSQIVKNGPSFGSASVSMNDAFWDNPAVRLRLSERQLSSEAVGQRPSYRHRRTT